MKSTSIVPFFWGCCISLFPSTEQLGPVTCELNPSLHSLFLPTCFCHHLPPPPLQPLILPFPLAGAAQFVGVTLYWGQRWRVLPANRKWGGSLFADQWQPYVFLWKIQPDNSRIRGGGGSFLKKTAIFYLKDVFIHLSGWIFHHLYCYSVRAPESNVWLCFFLLA